MHRNFMQKISKVERTRIYSNTNSSILNNYTYIITMNEITINSTEKLIQGEAKYRRKKLTQLHDF